MEKLHFNEFEAFDADQWKALATKELKGSSPDELVWQIEEGISCPPYLDSASEDSGLFFRSKYHGSFQWKVHVEFSAEEIQAQPQHVLDALSFGCNSVLITGCNDAQALIGSLNMLDLSAIDLKLQATSVNFEALAKELSDVGDKARPIRLTVDFNEASLSGLGTSHHRVSVCPGIQNQGGTAGMELAIAISQGHDAIVALLAEHSIDDVTPVVNFELGIGPLYLPEISKFRAMRRLWNRVVEMYEPQHSCTGYATIQASASPWFLSSIDTHTNLLRLTTMGASAAIGGADSIYLPAHNHLVDSTDHSTRRISLNIHNVLRLEGKLDWAADPARGSYTVERMTDSIASRAWSIFQNIESKGGYTAAKKSGYVDEIIQEDIRKSKEKWKAEASMIGVSEFQSPFDDGVKSIPGERLEILLAK